MRGFLISFCVCVVLLIVFLYYYIEGVDEYFDPIPKSHIKYFLDHAKSGDLVFFWSDNSKHGLGVYPTFIASSLQAAATKTPYTHVCLVVRDKSSSDLLFITSNHSPKQDVLGNMEKTGNQLCNAEQYLSEYKGRVCWYPINRAISDVQVAQAMRQFKSRYYYDYQYNILMFINLGLQLWDNKSHSEKTICTITVFDFLISAGVITNDNSYMHMNRANIGLRELEAAIIESERYDESDITELFIDLWE